MADNYVQVPPNSTGLKIETSELTRVSDGALVERQRVIIGDPTTIGALSSVDSILGLSVYTLDNPPMMRLLGDIKTELQNIVRLLGGQPTT